MSEQTYFAPAGRDDEAALAGQQHDIFQSPFIIEVLNAVPAMVLVLNGHRQIVAVNRKLTDVFQVADDSALLGLRPGEAVDCVHSKEGPDGCGTSEPCSACGAVLTILASQEKAESIDGECRIVISRNGGTALDLAVKATPVIVAGNSYTIFGLIDISSEKRREVLEHIFFHDVLNTAGGIRGVAGLLLDCNGRDPGTETSHKQLMVDLSDRLIEEINHQRRLLAVEKGEYVPEMRQVDLKELLENICTLYNNHARTPSRRVVLENVSGCCITTDGNMLWRVVGNMIINGLEASPMGGEVKVSLFVYRDEILINVTNSGEIPKEAQLQIFKRSFSTKASSGRGIGTYVMKLFGEQYLGGKVGFKSLNGMTMFFIRLPLTDVQEVV